MMNTKTIIATVDAPGAIGPYSQAVKVGTTVYCSGQIPLDPRTMDVVGKTAAEQAKQCLKNLEAVLKAAGGDFSHVVRVGIFMIDPTEFAAVNEVYSQAFSGQFPARTTIYVAGLPRGSLIEIDAIAVVPE